MNEKIYEYNARKNKSNEYIMHLPRAAANGTQQCNVDIVLGCMQYKNTVLSKSTAQSEEHVVNRLLFIQLGVGGSRYAMYVHLRAVY